MASNSSFSSLSDRQMFWFLLVWGYQCTRDAENRQTASLLHLSIVSRICLRMRRASPPETCLRKRDCLFVQAPFSKGTTLVVRHVRVLGRHCPGWNDGSAGFLFFFWLVGGHTRTARTSGSCGDSFLRRAQTVWLVFGVAFRPVTYLLPLSLECRGDLDSRGASGVLL